MATKMVQCVECDARVKMPAERAEKGFHCPKCGAQNDATQVLPAFIYDHQKEEQQADLKKRTKANCRYPALLIISKAIKGLAAAIGVLTLLWIAFVILMKVYADSFSWSVLILYLVATPLLAAILFVILWASAELIKLMIDVEENTRA